MEADMQRENGAEITFAVHPRPTTADMPGSTPAGRFQPRFVVIPRGTAPEDVSRHRDTPAGDLAFLARFAFGRY